MTGSNINRQRLLVTILFDLRKHFAGCRVCKQARIGRDFDLLCDLAKTSLVEVAVKWDSNIGRRLAARNSKDEHIFPCPNPYAHGEAYAAIAEPVTVTAHIGTLF